MNLNTIYGNEDDYVHDYVDYFWNYVASLGDEIPDDLSDDGVPELVNIGKLLQKFYQKNVDKRDCSICMPDEIPDIIVPCLSGKHDVGCVSCFEEIIKKKTTCPICRCDFRDWLVKEKHN